MTAISAIGSAGYVGGEEHGPGRRGRGKPGVRSKSVVAVAVERRGAGKPGQKPVPGFAALEVIPDAAAATMEKFHTDKVRAGSHILCDGWRGYRRLKKKGFEHTATPISTQDEPAHSLFPWVHITLSNLKRFLLGTHHKVESKHPPPLCRRIQLQAQPRSMEADLMTRLLRACIGTQTITYKQLTDMPELA